LKTEQPLVTIVIPVYNEENTIGDVLRRITTLQLRKEILVVDDGSNDNTGAILKRYPCARTIQHDSNRGKGAALRTGFAHGRGEVFVVQDADLEYMPEEIPAIVGPILAGVADVVYGSRFLGECDGMSLSHRIGNMILSGTTSLLYLRRVTDVMTGHKAFSRGAISSILLEEDGFEAEVGITTRVLRRKDLRFVEVPISYSYRLTGSSKIRAIDGLRCLLRLLKLRFTSAGAIRSDLRAVVPWPVVMKSTD
jgi:glycosyltransferase involved in cell wall biosynthesis